MQYKQLVGVCILPVALAFIAGCGGGGGSPYRPSVVVNRLNIHKMPWTEELREMVITSSVFPQYDERRKLRSAREQRYGHTYEGVYHAGMIFSFDLGGKEYLVTSQGKNVLVFNGEVLVKKLRIPRYMLWASVMTVELWGAQYVIIYINQQATSNTSTLFILDENLDVQYQEHLAGAEEIGLGWSEEYGDFLFIRSKNYMMVDGVKKPLNGDWLYIQADGDTR